MLTAVTLICNPAAPAVDAAAIVAARAGARSVGLERAEVRVLREGVAAELICMGEAEAACASSQIFAALKPRPIDVVVQPAEGRRRKLLVADMDSTIIGQECIDELADCAGKRAEVAGITERAMRGELDFEAALLERVAMLRGLPESVLERTFETRIRLNPGARTLIATMKKSGATTALVSGGFTFFTSRVAAAAGFDRHQANRLIVENGVLTGDVARPILGRAAKEEALIRIARENGVAPEDTLAVGDGANDLSMLARAGLGVAFRAKPSVAAAASARIDHGDLTALLYLQGIAAGDFADS